MNALGFAVCLFFAVVSFWLGLRFIVFHKYKIELFIGAAAILLSVHMALLLFFMWPPQ